jgi:hypothetical protein
MQLFRRWRAPEFYLKGRRPDEGGRGEPVRSLREAAFKSQKQRTAEMKRPKPAIRVRGIMSGDAPRVLKRTTVTAVVTLAVLAACDDGPTRPSSPATPPAPQPAPIPVVRLEIVGPDRIAPGESVQYSAIMHQSDGSSRDVTREAVWHSGVQGVLTVSTSGLATGHERGATSLNASVGPAYSSKEVLVLPAQTYRLTGTVRDAGFTVTGARVDVMAGLGRGLVATTIGGTYVLWGVGGDVELRVTRDGFQEQKKRVLVTTHQEVDFDLILSRPRPEIAGRYTLTLNADTACSAALPEEARVRRYTAVATQQGPRVSVTLEGSTFYRHHSGALHNAFEGTMDQDRVRFLIFPAMGYYYYYDFPILDVLSPDIVLQISGSAWTAVTPAGLVGALSGWIETRRVIGAGSFETINSCSSTRHQFVLTR